MPRKMPPKRSNASKLYDKGLGYPVAPEDFSIQRSNKPIKPPTIKEIQGMRQREIIRKAPQRTV